MALSEITEELHALVERWKDEQKAWEFELATLDQAISAASEQTQAQVQSLAERIERGTAALLDEAADICKYPRPPIDPKRASAWRDRFFLHVLPERLLEPGAVLVNGNWGRSWPPLATEIKKLWERADGFNVTDSFQARLARLQLGIRLGTLVQGWREEQEAWNRELTLLEETPSAAQAQDLAERIERRNAALLQEAVDICGYSSPPTGPGSAATRWRQVFFGRDLPKRLLGPGAVLNKGNCPALATKIKELWERAEGPKVTDSFQARLARVQLRAQLGTLAQRWREEQEAWNQELTLLEETPSVAQAEDLAERIERGNAALLQEAAAICKRQGPPPGPATAVTRWREGFFRCDLPKRLLGPGAVLNKGNWPAWVTEIQELWERADGSKVTDSFQARLARVQLRAQLGTLAQRWREEQKAWSQELTLLEETPSAAQAQSLAERIERRNAALLREAAVDICGYSPPPPGPTSVATQWRDHFFGRDLPKRLLGREAALDKENWPAWVTEIQQLWERADGSKVTDSFQARLARVQLRAKLGALTQRWREEQEAWNHELTLLEERPSAAQGKGPVERIERTSAALLHEAAVDICGYSPPPPGPAGAGTQWRRVFFRRDLPKRLLGAGAVQDRGDWPAWVTEIEALWQASVSLQARAESLRNLTEVKPTQGGRKTGEPRQMPRNRFPLPRAKFDHDPTGPCLRRGF